MNNEQFSLFIVNCQGEDTMSKDLILAIDNGTQSVRALIFDLRGNLVALSRVPIEPYFSTAPGLAEQRPEVFWDAICLACQQLWLMPGVRKDAIAGVALTTQRGTMINVDKDGQPLRPAIVWLDQRRTEGLKPVGGVWGLAFALSGMTGTVAYLQAEAEANWLRTHQQEVWDKTYKYLYLSGYLTYKLTGRFVDSVGCQVGFMPFDYKKLRWAADWPRRSTSSRSTDMFVPSYGSAWVPPSNHCSSVGSGSRSVEPSAPGRSDHTVGSPANQAMDRLTARGAP